MFTDAGLSRPGRHSAHHRIVGHISHDHGIRTYDHAVTDVNAAENLGACANLHAIADRRRAEQILVPAVADGDSMANQAIIADHARAMNDDAAMMLDTQASADTSTRADGDAANDLDQLAEHRSGDGPGGPQNLVLDAVSGVAKAIHQERPVPEPEHSFALRF